MKRFLYGYIQAGIDFGKCLHLEVRVKDFYDHFDVPLLCKLSGRCSGLYGWGWDEGWQIGQM